MMKKNRRGNLAKFLLVCIIGFVTVQNVEGNNVDEVVNELSAVARLLNGMAILNDFTSQPENTKKVIAEFLKMPKSGLLDDFGLLDVDGLFKNLTSFHTAVMGTSDPAAGNLEAFQKSIGLLEEMKSNTRIMSLTKSNSQETAVSSSLAEDVTTFKTYFNSNIIKRVINALTTIRDSDPNSIGASVCETTLNSLKMETGRLNRQWDDLKNYTDKLENVLKLKDIEVTLADTFQYAQLSKDFKGNMTIYQTFNTEVTSVIGDLTSLNGIKSGSHDLDDITKRLKRVNEYSQEISVKNGITKALTTAFPTSSSEIGLIVEDFKKSSMLKALSEGRSWNNVSKKMEPLMKFHVEMKKLEETWNGLLRDPALSTTFSGVIDQTNETSNYMSHLNGISAVSTSLHSINECVASLANPTSSFDFNKFESLKASVAQINDAFDTFEKEMKLMTGNETALEQLRTLLNEMTNLTDYSDTAEFVEPFKKIKASPVLASTIQLLDSFKNKLTWFSNEDALGKLPTFAGKDWTMLTNVFNSLDGTSISNTLTCLQGKQYNVDGLIGLMDLRTRIQSMKNNNSEMGKVLLILSSFSKAAKELDATQKAMAKTRRRRETKTPFPLKKYGQISMDVGRGLESLRSLGIILKAGGTIEAIIESPPVVHSAAESADGVWSESNRDKLKSTLEELKGLDKFAGAQKGKNLEKVWLVFAEAEKIKGPEIDASLFQTQIYQTLQTSQDPTVRSSAQNFQRLSSLDLHFQSHHEIRVKSASVALIPIREYFDSVFGIERHGGSTVVEKGIDPLKLGLIVAGGVSAVLVAIGGFFVVKHVRANIEEKKNWKNRERLWIYYGFINDTYNICLAAKNDMQKEVKQMIKEKIQLNRYWRGATALHYAVRFENPGMVELLIKAGANRDLQNEYGQTAEDMCTHKSFLNEDGTEDEEKDPIKIAEIVAIFNKYRDKKFQHPAPKQMPWSDFRCSFLFCDLKVAEEFTAMYPVQIHAPNSDLLHTHSVVDVDENGVFNIDPFRGDIDDPDDVFAMHTIFSPMVLVSTEWARQVIQNPKNFTKDYEYRVTKVKYLGVVYETIDEWKRWVRGKTISCGHRMSCYFSGGSEDYNNKFNSIAYYLFSDYFNLTRDALDEIAKTDKPGPFWHPNKKRVILIKHMAVEDIFNNEFPPHVREKCEVLQASEFWTWLLAMDGSKGMVNPVMNRPTSVMAPPPAEAPPANASTPSAAAPPVAVPVAAPAAASVLEAKKSEKKSNKSTVSGMQFSKKDN